jgi:hypothetical protein
MAVLVRVLARSSPPPVRIGQPEDVAGAAVFLARPAAWLVTGRLAGRRPLNGRLRRVCCAAQPCQYLPGSRRCVYSLRREDLSSRLPLQEVSSCSKLCFRNMLR